MTNCQTTDFQMPKQLKEIDKLNQQQTITVEHTTKHFRKLSNLQQECYQTKQTKGKVELTTSDKQRWSNVRLNI